MNDGDIIKFDSRKQFKHIKPLGSGGTGDTYLFLDETTDMHFAIKKYSPKQLEYRDELFYRFVEEIKILFNISHPNIVRIYNYYLYPEFKIGYLQMEYIEGTPIDEYVQEEPRDKDIETIFEETISAFRYLERHHILHRDIRPSNILIDKDQCVKVIDFGFGKLLKNIGDYVNSVCLNWDVTEYPEELLMPDRIYTHQSEIYFLGKLFYKLWKDHLSTFRYTYILEKMIKVSKDERYYSFEDIEKEISVGILGELNFTSQQKTIYKEFANALYSNINFYVNEYSTVNDIQSTLKQLETAIKNSSLEELVQDNSMIIGAFINCEYNYRSNANITVDCVLNFYKFFNSLDIRKQKVVMDNIYVRLGTINVEKRMNDDIPF